MTTIRVVGMIFYRCMVISFLYVIAANVFQNTASGYNSLLVGLIIGILGSFLSGVHKPSFI